MPDRSLASYEETNILGNVAPTGCPSRDASPQARNNASEINRGSAEEEETESAGSP